MGRLPTTDCTTQRRIETILKSNITLICIMRDESQEETEPVDRRCCVESDTCIQEDNTDGHNTPCS